MQRAEIEEMRQREANMTALLAIGPRKRIKLDNSSTSSNQVFIVLYKNWKLFVTLKDKFFIYLIISLVSLA